MGAVFKLTSPKENIGVYELFEVIGRIFLANINSNNIVSKENSLLYHTIIGAEDGFEIIKKNNIKLDKFVLKKMKRKKSC